MNKKQTDELSKHLTETVLRTVNKKLTDKETLANGAMGAAGEAGEIVDIVKKHMFQGHPLDKDKLISEVGDVLYYLQLLAHTCGFSLNDSLRNNSSKLSLRYPSGFSENDSLQRVDTQKKKCDSCIQGVCSLSSLSKKGTRHG